MRVYVAAPWKHKEHAKEVVKRLHTHGFTVVSRWVNFEVSPDVVYDYPDQVMEQESVNDIQDLNLMDVMLYLNLEKSEGKATELGFAIAREIPVYVVGGKQNNVFLHLPQINHIPDVEEFIWRMAEVTNTWVN